MTTIDVDRRGERPTGRGLAALMLATVAVFADVYITQPILPLLSREFRIGPATAGLSISFVVLAVALSSSLYGALSDRVGRKPVMVASCLLLAVPTLLCAVMPTFPSLLACRALQGLLMPGLTAVAVTYLGDHFSGAELGRVVGRWIAASVMGGLSGRVLSGLIASVTHWRAPFLVFGLLTLAGGAGMARELPASPPRGGGAAEGGGLAEHFRNRRLVGAFLIGGSVFFAFIAVFTYLPYYLTAPPFGLSTAVVSSLYVVYLAGVFTSLLTARPVARWGRRAVMGAGFVIAGAGVLGTAVRSLPLIVPSLVVLCIGMFCVQSTAPAFVNVNARGAKGAAGALYVSFYYLGATFGAFLPGYAWQAWGWPGVMGCSLTALLVGFLADALLCG